MAITRTGTRALPDSWEAWWKRARKCSPDATRTWPIVDSIILDEGRDPAITLVAPKVVPGTSHVFVDFARLSTDDRNKIDELLRAIEAILRSAGFSQKLWAILHAGGTDYEFQSREGRTIALKELPRFLQPVVWALVQWIAALGVASPDITASQPREAVPILHRTCVVIKPPKLNC